MSNEPAASGGVDPDVPDAVIEWLSSVAAEHGVSETELLRSLLAGASASDPEGGTGTVDHLEREFRSMVDDVRDRIVQVKRETDEKAPADHAHHDLQTAMDQLGQELAALDATVSQLDDRVSVGFENYEEILTYLTDTTDALDRKIGQLAATVIDLRERVGDTTRDEVRRAALVHLTDTANRHGIGTAKCDNCSETVHIGMLVEPRCPHCDSLFSALEPKSGFFRSSVLHTGTLPALESGPDDPDDQGSLESLVRDADEEDGGVPSVVADHEPADRRRGRAPEMVETPTPAERAETPESSGADGPPAEEASVEDDADRPPDSPPDQPDQGSDGAGDLRTIDGVGPAYADRLRAAGVDDLLTLAVADPTALGEAIDVPETAVADWVDQADSRTGAT